MESVLAHPCYSSFDVHLPCLGTVPVLSHPESPQGAPPLQGWLQSPDGCSILCLLKRQVALLVYARYLSEIIIFYPAALKMYYYCGY